MGFIVKDGDMVAVELSRFLGQPKKRVLALNRVILLAGCMSGESSVGIIRSDYGDLT